MKKVIVIAAGVLVAAVIGISIFLLSNLDSLVKKAIETIGSQVAGVPVRVSDVKIALTEGKGTLRGLSVANPPGFTSDTAFKLGEITLALDPGSVTKDPVVVTQILIAGPEVTYEVGASGSNISVIQANVQSSVGGGGKSEADKPAATTSSGKSGPNLVVDKLDITGGKVTLATAIPGAKASGALGDIHLTGIGRSSGGASAAQVAQAILGALTKSAINSASSLGVGAGVDALKKAVDGNVDPNKAVEGLKGLLGK